MPGLQTIDCSLLLSCKALSEGGMSGKKREDGMVLSFVNQVPFCMNIRQKLMEQKRSLARRADMMMRRRMEGLSAVANANAASSNAPSTSTSLPSSSNPNPPSTG